MSDLPTGWEWTTLDEVGDYLNGRAFKQSEWSTHGRPIIRIQNLTGSGSTFNYYDGDLEDKHVVQRGDHLISWAATLGSFIWQGPEAALNQHIFKVHSHINKTFHHYLVDYLINELAKETHGSGMVHVTRGKFGNLKIALPPLGEQRRIVEVLENHLSHIQTGIQILQSSLTRTTRYRENFITASCTGTNSGQEKGSTSSLPNAGVQDGALPDIPANWRWMRLGEIADVVGGVTKDAKKQSDPALPEVPYLRVANVQRREITTDDVATIRVPVAKIEQLRLKEGDVLLNEGGDRDKLARGWVWESQLPLCIHQNHVFRARIREGILHPKLLAWHANSFGKAWAEANGKQSVNLASISLSKIRLLPVPVPPINEQGSLVEAIEEHLTMLDRQMMSLRLALHRANSLHQSLLAEAFSGQLASQDPNDEPASALLERIRAERSVTPKAKQARPTKTKTAEASPVQESLL
jgi:type I restriction enzyme S subunit